MELDEFKSGWQKAGDPFKTEAELLSMTKITHHPTLKKIRQKLLIESVLLTLFLVVYYDGFDGHQKPFYANALLVASVILYVGNGVLGYVSLLNPVRRSNIKDSLAAYLASLQRLSVWSLLFSVGYSVALLVFFSSVITFSKEKSFLLLGAVILLVQATLWSRRIWTKRIRLLREQSIDLGTG
jgi:hypothetical protein